jgi:hypothetical protein
VVIGVTTRMCMKRSSGSGFAKLKKQIAFC